MSHEKPTQDPFLAAIEAKIAAWTAVAESYRNAVALDGPLGDVGSQTGTPHARPTGPTTGGKPMDLPVGVFRDKSIKEAIEIYLAAGHRKQTNKEIAVGLQKGGIATTSVNFEATVGTALHRMRDEGLILRFPDGWDLAKSYPDSLRARLEKDAKPRRAVKKIKKVKAAKASAPDAPKTWRFKISKAKKVAEPAEPVESVG